MRFDMTGLAPVSIALDRIEVEGDVRFTGLDLDSGRRVTVTIERSEKTAGLAGDTRDVAGLVLVLTLGRTAGVEQ